MPHSNIQQLRKSMQWFAASELLLIGFFFFIPQSIEREEPIEVDHTPTPAGLENGHSAATGSWLLFKVHQGWSHSNPGVLCEVAV